jgi:xanthine dehydrogenase YagS FAD-binding subunit
MNMRPFAHARAQSLEEACAALSDSCRPLAGGTDLLALMKEGLAAPQSLVSLKSIPGLDRLTCGADGWRIGATVTLARLASEPTLQGRPEVAVLVEALLASASPQLRHMATIGGNLLQRPRCWYYRNPLVPCWRKGGQLCYAYRGENQYHVLLGGGPCHAVHPSDPAVALLALDAAVEAVGPRGVRSLPLQALYRLPTREERSDALLAPDELLSAVLIPASLTGTRSCYLKVAGRAAWDFALVSVAVQVSLAEGVVQRARIALGGVAPIPWRAAEAEKSLLGGPLDSASAAEAARLAVVGSRPLAHNGYKVDLLQNLLRQALVALGPA